MDIRCEVCGCPTDSAELREYSIGGEKVNACRTCVKSLKAIEAAPAENRSRAFDLANMNTSGRRSDKVQLALVNRFAQLGIIIVPVVPQQVIPPQPVVPPVQTVTPPSAMPVSSTQTPPQAVTEQQQIDQLRKDLIDLKFRFDRFYKRYLISKILSIALPILLILIMLIIVIKSGAIENLVNYYNTITEYANM